MKSKLGISKQLFIALTIVNLSVTLFSVVLGYVIYNYAIEKGWISLSSFQQEDWTSFHFVDWIWLATVIFLRLYYFISDWHAPRKAFYCAN